MDNLIRDINRLNLTQLIMLISLVGVGVVLPWVTVIYDRLKRKAR